MKIIFRPHAMGITVFEAIAEKKEFDTFEKFTNFIKDVYFEHKGKYNIYINLYGGFKNEFGADERIGWSNTFIVGFKNLDEYGPVLGFMTIQS